ncbi:MAG: type I DNA topoisomerase [Spirochaetales bacterium]|nr:type I DNA topoisomerase [Spirochaetales bacterium]
MAIAKAETKKKAGKPRKKGSGKDKTLVIVESPAKARTINKYLGNSYIIEASMGHIIDLPKSRIAVDVENDFKPEYITVRGRAKILNRLKKLASSSRNVLLAADPDREGEAISWHLANALRDKNSDIKRIEFNEITQSAVKEAVLQPRDIDIKRVEAQQARRILDRLVGYNISPILWKKIKRGLSAGRVQSVALRLICEREKEIEAFVPVEYWTVDGKFQAEKGKSLEATLAFHNGQKIDLRDEASTTAVVDEATGKTYSVKEISRKERKRQPSAPYTTSRLQQDAANKLGFTSQKTMMVAQQLYEGIEIAGSGVVGLISYMRTDSTRISDGALASIRDFITKEVGPDFLSPAVRTYKAGKSAQEAHEAIRPTDVFRTPESIAASLSRDQYRLYNLVWQKAVSSQMADEISDHTTVTIENSDGPSTFTFRASGKTVKFPGFARIFDLEDKKKSGSDLPQLNEGQPLELKKLSPEQHFTQPPPRFSDASMVKTLEESGVGRPSTYAPTINTLLKRFYCVRLQKALKPTELGMLVNQILTNHFSHLVDIDFTARMEDDLDKIATSDMNWVEMLRQFYNPFALTVETAQTNIAEMRGILDVDTDLTCEKCGRKMVRKIGRNGYFLACSGFPECRNARAIPLGKCPVCTDGDVVKRATKRGRPFYGCNRYPDCDFSTWDRPVEETCPECGKLLLEKSSREKGKYIGCSSCSYEAASQSA